MKQPTWFYRQLFGYLPMFLVICALLILIALQLLGEQSKRSAMQMNRMTAGQMLQLLDQSLRAVDDQMMREILNNRQLLTFYQTKQPEPLFIYEAVRVLREMVGGNSMVDSVYLYDVRNRLVLTPLQALPVDDFADKAFVLEHARLAQPFTWSGFRPYTEHRSLAEPAEVASFVRRVPVPNGYYGLIVVNVRADKVRELLGRFSPGDGAFVRLYDSQGGSMFGGTEPNARLTRGDRLWTEVQSDYTGWTVRSGMTGAGWYGVLGGFSLTLLGIAASAVLAGMLWIVYRTRKSSRPIEAIISRLQPQEPGGGQRTGWTSSPDEMKLIETAVVDLMERSQFYENRRKEDLIYRRKQLFREAASGENGWSEPQFRRQLQELGLPAAFDCIQPVVLELDRYMAFEAGYSLKDQYLLKFALRSAVKEIAQAQGMTVWEEWTTASQLSLLYLLSETFEQPPGAVTTACSELIEWVQGHLPFTVTAAIGPAVPELTALPGALENAGELLRYKSVIGNSRTIGYWDVRHRHETSDATLRQLQTIRRTIASFKAGEAGWAEQLLQFCALAKEAMATRDDLAQLIHFFVYSLHKEVMDWPAAYQEYWNETAFARLTAAIQSFDTMEELQQRLLRELQAYEERLSALRQKGNPRLIADIKAYIGRNYAEAGLSLQQISDAFDISTTYFSRLFKEETGETFVSYLTQARLHAAKRLLLETDAPVQDIAVRVGYVHAFSFIRVFKKAFGLTPGDFRKHREQAEQGAAGGPDERDEDDETRRQS